MSNESAFRTLLASAAVTALVSDRIFPVLAEQSCTRPYIVYSRASSDPQNSLGGFTAALERIRWQVDCYAETFDSAIAIAAAVRAAVAAGGSGIQGICINELDFFEDDTRLFRRLVEFSVFHRS